MSSGETLPRELVLQFRVRMPGRRLINLYGSSEVSADSTCYDVEDEVLPSRIPVGKPIDNTRIYLLDKHMQPVPMGVTGEVCVEGAGVAREYLNRYFDEANFRVECGDSDDFIAELWRSWQKFK